MSKWKSPRKNQSPLPNDRTSPSRLPLTARGEQVRCARTRVSLHITSATAFMLPRRLRPPRWSLTATWEKRTIRTRVDVHNTSATSAHANPRDDHRFLVAFFLRSSRRLPPYRYKPYYNYGICTIIRRGIYCAIFAKLQFLKSRFLREKCSFLKNRCVCVWLLY